MQRVTINRKQRLYVIEHDKGYTCCGYDYAERLRVGVLDWLGKECEPMRKGSLKHYFSYREAMALGAAHHAATGQRCNAELVPQLEGREGQRVEVIDCYNDKRRFIVGKSTGWLPCHLEIKRRDSTGGIGAMGYPFKSIRTV